MEKMKFIEWLVLLSILVGLNETTVPKTILPNGTTAANNPAGNEDIDGVSKIGGSVDECRAGLFTRACIIGKGVKIKGYAPLDQEDPIKEMYDEFVILHGIHENPNYHTPNAVMIFTPMSKRKRDFVRIFDNMEEFGGSARLQVYEQLRVHGLFDVVLVTHMMSILSKNRHIITKPMQVAELFVHLLNQLKSMHDYDVLFADKLTDDDIFIGIDITSNDDESTLIGNKPLGFINVLAAKSSDPTQSKKDVSYLTCIMENLLKPMKGIEDYLPVQHNFNQVRTLLRTSSDELDNEIYEQLVGIFIRNTLCSNKDLFSIACIRERNISAEGYSIQPTCNKFLYQHGRRIIVNGFHKEPNIDNQTPYALIAIMPMSKENYIRKLFNLFTEMETTGAIGKCRVRDTLDFRYKYNLLLFTHLREIDFTKLIMNTAARVIQPHILSQLLVCLLKQLRAMYIYNIFFSRKWSSKDVLYGQNGPSTIGEDTSAMTAEEISSILANPLLLINVFAATSTDSSYSKKNLQSLYEMALELFLLLPRNVENRDYMTIETGFADFFHTVIHQPKKIPETLFDDLIQIFEPASGIFQFAKSTKNVFSSLIYGKDPCEINLVAVGCIKLHEIMDFEPKKAIYQRGHDVTIFEGCIPTSEGHPQEALMLFVPASRVQLMRYLERTFGDLRKTGGFNEPHQFTVVNKKHAVLVLNYLRGLLATHLTYIEFFKPSQIRRIIAELLRQLKYLHLTEKRFFPTEISNQHLFGGVKKIACHEFHDEEPFLLLNPLNAISMDDTKGKMNIFSLITVMLQVRDGSQIKWDMKNREIKKDARILAEHFERFKDEINALPNILCDTHYQNVLEIFT